MPELIQPFGLHWYALGCMAGILQGRLYARAIINAEALWRGPPPLAVADYDAFIPRAVLGALVGGRIGHVLLHDPAYFMMHPAEVVQFWKGGMSFYGGLVGVAVAVLLFARTRRIPILALSDLTAAAYPIVHFFGWIANMINGALPGRPTDMPWAKWFPPGEAGPRHPSQIYEAVLEGLTLLFLLGILVRGGALKRPGLVLGAFAIGYGLFRCGCELFRAPQPQLSVPWGGPSMGIQLSIVLVLIGAALIWRNGGRPAQTT